MSPGQRRLYAPWPVAVEVDRNGRPHNVAGVAVEAIREEWVIEDRWWLLPRLWRHYFELVLADGRSAVVFRSSGERWYQQRA